MDKYPLGLSILETEQPTDADVDAARVFIEQNKYKQLNFDEIERLYYDCTPEYVSCRIYEIMSKLKE